MYLARRIREATGFRGARSDNRACHLIVGTDGMLHQCASFLVAVWHIEASGTVAGNHYEAINRVTLGIEIENAGRLVPNEGPLSTAEGPPLGARVPGPAKPSLRVAGGVDVAGRGRFAPFTRAQEDAAVSLVRALAAAYALPPEAFEYGRSSFGAPSQESPGPLWMEQSLPRVLRRAFAAEEWTSQRKSEDASP
jgi:N-acetyl-anhydromuramyl-L-alanine amidase AmpD